ncbi:transglycosylase domain-containing protein [Donghicola mangrovi]|uniref:peptidoglycan glycosyltransferase n=1 Tax=Donghicola mangrovi TaxID=2729614 RepID=A0A850Q6L8_9RHOB|nr:transglycosylase domain-containing protein [Donghicola mangrovi]NVO22340.1 penicillin-binding protein [Donghicola mangrovi]
MVNRTPGGGRLVADRRSRPEPPKKQPAPQKPKTPKAKKPRRPAKRGLISGLLFGFFGLIWRIIWGFGWRIGMIGALIIGAGVLYIYSTLPPVADLVDGRARGSVTLLDRNGSVFAWRGDQFGGMVTAENVSPYLKNAIVATEDRRFYMHPGVDPIGVASAVKINLSEGRGPLSGNGGSTITQQTAKLLCLGVPYDPNSGMTETQYEEDCRQTTLWRKIKEAIYAMAMEVKYSKNEILTIYMNRAFLGAGTRGFEAASQRYFGKSAATVTPAESAMLAGLLKAPTRYAPTNNLERAQQRANIIVGLMEEQGYLTPSQASTAVSSPAQLSEAAEAKAGGYFADWVMSDGPEFFTRETTEDVIIKTTLDQRIQLAAEDAMKTIFETKVSETSKAQAAIIVMSADGAVRAMVGGRKTKVSGVFNRATSAKRQTGSAFKPFVYATALELGHHWNSTVVDEPYTIDIPGSGPWSPENYDHKHYGRVTLEYALAHSLNVPAVKVSEAVGRENVRKVASDFGINSNLAEGPALALGASEATLIEVTGAYAGILNGGSSVKPYGLTELRLLGDDAPLMGTEGGIGERVISEAAAQELIYMMSKVVSEGTGTRARLKDREAAGKTGTTSAARDAWFVGFTADYVAGVWMGYDDNTPLKGVTGGGLPAEIWHETMVRVHEGVPAKPLPMLRPAPEPVAQRQPDLPSRGNVPQQQTNPVDGVLRDVLNSLFGAGN